MHSEKSASSYPSGTQVSQVAHWFLSQLFRPDKFIDTVRWQLFNRD